MKISRPGTQPKQSPIIQALTKYQRARPAKKPADLAHAKPTTIYNLSIYKMTACPTCMKTSRSGTQPKEPKQPKQPKQPKRPKVNTAEEEARSTEEKIHEEQNPRTLPVKI